MFDIEYIRWMREQSDDSNVQLLATFAAQYSGSQAAAEEFRAAGNKPMEDYMLFWVGRSLEQYEQLRSKLAASGELPAALADPQPQALANLARPPRHRLGRRPAGQARPKRHVRGDALNA
jgi:hypothetical protein